jgi:hypothetical protein
MYCCETSFHELYNELHCQNLIVNWNVDMWFLHISLIIQTQLLMRMS